MTCFFTGCLPGTLNFASAVGGAESSGAKSAGLAFFCGLKSIVYFPDALARRLNARATDYHSRGNFTRVCDKRKPLSSRSAQWRCAAVRFFNLARKLWIEGKLYLGEGRLNSFETAGGRSAIHKASCSHCSLRYNFLTRLGLFTSFSLAEGINASLAICGRKTMKDTPKTVFGLTLNGASNRHNTRRSSAGLTLDRHRSCSRRSGFSAFAATRSDSVHKTLARAQLPASGAITASYGINERRFS